MKIGNMPIYTTQLLSEFDGSNPDKPILLALDGYVYDVSAGKADFYGEGEVYHELVGRDASKMLRLFGADIIKNKYKVVGVYNP